MTKGKVLTPLRAETCSTREAAGMLGVSLRTVQLWVDGGMLDAWKTVGGHRRVTIASIERLAAGLASDGPDNPRTQARLRKDAPLVLVAEDDPDLLKLYQASFEAWDLPIILQTATNGFDCLLRIGNRLPELLITDLDMPGMDGFQMLRVLRDNPGYGQMAIAVVTGLDKADVEARGGIPADVVLYRKPVPFERLRAMVETLLVQRRPARASAR